MTSSICVCGKCFLKSLDLGNSIQDKLVDNLHLIFMTELTFSFKSPQLLAKTCDDGIIHCHGSFSIAQAQIEDEGCFMLYFVDMDKWSVPFSIQIFDIVCGMDLQLFKDEVVDHYTKLRHQAFRADSTNRAKEILESCYEKPERIFDVVGSNSIENFRNFGNSSDLKGNTILHHLAQNPKCASLELFRKLLE